MNYDTAKLQVQYKNALLGREILEKRLADLRTQTQRVIQARNQIEKYRKNQMVQLKHNLKTAIQKRDYKGIAKYSKDISKVEREMKSYKSLGKTSYKVNLLTKQNLAVEKQIQAKMEVMAMREARARNIITRNIAKVNNGIDSVKLKVLHMKSNWKQYRLKNTVENYNKKYATSINYKVKGLNRDLSIAKKTNIEQSDKDTSFKTTQTTTAQMNYDKIKANYDKVNNGNSTVYTNKNNGVEVVDKGDTLKLGNVKNASDKDKINALLDVAEAKGWDLSKIEVNGSKEFKAKSQEMINQRLGKTNETVNKASVNTAGKSASAVKSVEMPKNASDKDNVAMANMYKELNKVKADNERLKQQLKAKEQQQKTSKLDNAFSQIDKMNKSQVNSEDIRKSQQQEKQNSQKNSISR